MTCVVTTSLTCVTGGSATSNTLTMTVNPTVATSLSITVSPNDTICAGTSVTFTAVPVNGGSPTYLWRINGGSTGITTSTFATTGLTNGQVVTCDMGSSLTCPSPATAVSNPITMTVNPVVSPTITITASPGTTICAGTVVTFSASITNGGSSPSYQWFVGGSPVGGNSPTFSTSSLINGNTVTCTLISNAPCATVSTVNSNTLTITVTAPVTPTISISANPGTTICAGTNVTFTASVTNGGGSPFYQWSVNGAPVGSNSFTYSTSGLGNGDTVTCVMTTSLTCVTGSSATSNTLTMTVEPVVTPTISISANPGFPVCQGTPVTFTATITNGGSNPTYVWKLNGNPTGVTLAVYTNSSLTTTDIVTCELTSNASCVSSPVVTSNPIVASMTTLNTVVNVNGPVLTAQQAGASYQWVDCNNGFAAVAGATSQSFTATVSGNYAVVLNLSGCADTSGCNSVIIAAVDGSGAVQKWTVYPNPSNGKFTLDPGNAAGQAEIWITDDFGKVVKWEKVDYSGRFESEINVAAGVYTLHIHSEGFDTDVKLVIIR